MSPLVEMKQEPPLPDDLRVARHYRKYRPTGTGTQLPGYTRGMKTTVSIPEDVYRHVERFARRTRRSRSEVYSAALREYVNRHAPDEVTEAMNRVCAETDTGAEDFGTAAARHVLERSEW